MKLLFTILIVSAVIVIAMIVREWLMDREDRKLDQVTVPKREGDK